MTLLFWISGVALAVMWFVPVVQAAVNMRHIDDITLPDWKPPVDTVLPSLDVVVPARNEQAALEPALESLLNLDYPQARILAVNDRSSDRTGEIMERLARSSSNLKVTHIKELPAGWLGKTHAMWQGASQGRGEWILFTDADCIFHPESLRRAVWYATQEKLDHLVVFPTPIMKSFGERMIIPFLCIQTIFSPMHRPWKVSDPQARDHIGMGAFNLVRRSAYEAVGGFERLRLEVIDDVKLGETLKTAGFRQQVALGPEMVRLHWAPGAMGIIRNLNKNIFAYLKFNVALALAVCLLLFVMGVWPVIGLALAPGWAKAGFAAVALMCAGMYAGMSRYTRTSPWLFATFPVASCLFGYGIVQSAFLALRDGGITWRGTKYSIEELRNRGAAAGR